MAIEIPPGLPVPRAVPARLQVIDGARGAALAAMVVFHAGWDAAWLGLTPGPGVAPGWQAFGNAVAAAFLTLSGMSLVLAARRGGTTGRALRRFALLLAAAYGLTAATWIAVPQMTIFFGILHCIAIGGLLAWPLVRSPMPLVLALALAVFAVAALPLPAALQAPGWGWLGLGAHVPSTLDYRPLIPWAGFILLGIGVARVLPERWLGACGTQGPVSSALAWAGRHSLALYLTHQAILFPALFLVALSLGVSRPGDTTAAWLDSFERQCRSDCLDSGAGSPLCVSVCACTRARIEAAGSGSGPKLLPTIPIERKRLSALTEACFLEARP